MTKRSLITSLLFIVAAASSAAAQTSFRGNLFGERVRVTARVFTTSAREQKLRVLFDGEDAGRLVAKTEDFEKALSDSRPADDLKVESTTSALVTLARGPRIGDAAYRESGETPGTLLATVSLGDSGVPYYNASVELAGPLGGFRATLGLSSDETAIFPLPGNVMAPAQASSRDHEPRRAYVAIQIVPAPESSSSIKSAAN